MAKWVGIIGFGKTQETEPSIWKEVITERRYVGDLLINRIKNQNSGNINDNINISNRISIIADPYATSNIGYIKYAEFMGSKWKITDVEVQYPRLILSLGGLFNE